MDARPPDRRDGLEPHVEEVMERVAESASAEGMGRDPRRSFLTRAYVVIPLVLVFLGVWGWNLARWNTPPESLPAGEEENVQRVSLFVAARIVESYRSEHGRLPETLEEAGLTHPDMAYRREGTTYTLEVRGDQGSREFRSSQSPEEVLRGLGDERGGNP